MQYNILAQHETEERDVPPDGQCFARRHLFAPRGLLSTMTDISQKLRGITSSPN